MFQRNLGWIRNKRNLTSSSTRQLLQNNMGLTIYLEGGYVTFFRRRKVFFRRHRNLIFLFSGEVPIWLKQGELWSNAHLWYPFHFPWYGVPIWSLWPNTRFLPSIVAQKNVTKNILEGRTDRGKTVYPPPPSGSGGIIRSKIGSKCVDLILIRLAKCWNNFFSSKFCIWLYCENVKSEYIFFSCPAKFFSSRFRIKIIF